MRTRLLSLLVAALSLGYCSQAQAANALDELKAQFNKDKGAPRLIVLVSPTCPACVGGAQWIHDEILKEYPTLNIHVYAIWYEMYPGDSPKAFPSAKKTMPDARVTHYWDKKKATGRWFKTHVPSASDKPIMWDAYYLYDANAEWGTSLEPLVSHGRTILETRKELLRQISLLDGKQKGSPQE